MTTTYACSTCGADAVGGIDGDFGSRHWCEDHARPAPVAPVYAARGLVWLAEAARDLGIEPVSMMWRNGGHPGHEVRVPTRAALDALGDRLGLGPASVADWIASRAGTWADMNVFVYCGTDR